MATPPAIAQADLQFLTTSGIDAYQQALASAADNPLEAAISQIGQTLAARGVTAEQILQLQLLLREAMQNLLREFSGMDGLPVLRSGLGELLTTLFDTTLAPSVAEALPDFSSRNNKSITDTGASPNNGSGCKPPKRLSGCGITSTGRGYHQRRWFARRERPK